MDDFVDHEGRRTFESVDPGHVSIEGTWGDREGRTRTTPIAGQTSRVRLVLRPAHGARRSK